MRKIAQWCSRLRFVILVLMVVGSGGRPVRADSHEQRAPGFSYLDLNNQKVDLASYRGKVVLLNFWATWCGPCLIELPRFAEWQQQIGPKSLQIIGVSMDDSDKPVRTAYQKYRLNYPVVMGDEKIGEKYGGILGLPVSFLIDRKGNIRFEHRGETDLDGLYGELQTLIQNR